MNAAELKRLQHKAAELRKCIVLMMGANKPHHFGGSLSAADLIVALYFYKMRFDPTDPSWEQRDRFIMSKGHSVPAQYAALAMLGVIPMEELQSLKSLGSRLQGHPAMHLTPGMEGCTGALGEGLSYANGIALAGRISNRTFRVYCLLGDGELQEGQVWEAAMTAATHRLDNIVAIIDRNQLKAMDETNCSKVLDPLAKRWSSFGWAIEEIDGHDIREICRALDWTSSQTKQPSAIIANTIKGKGVSFIEGQSRFHNSALSDDEFQLAIEEVNNSLKHTLEG